MTNLRAGSTLGKTIERGKDHAPRCGGYGLACMLLENHDKTRQEQTGTNCKLGWVAIRVDEDFKGVVPGTALDKIP